MKHSLPLLGLSRSTCCGELLNPEVKVTKPALLPPDAPLAADAPLAPEAANICAMPPGPLPALVELVPWLPAPPVPPTAPVPPAELAPDAPLAPEAPVLVLEAAEVLPLTSAMVT
ncbi:MAG TPA: hypothetical protein VKV28_07790 [Candidatus Binataceae bacterium]|nr:hypothetical protein [Candidatus Binataceae bacterium]